MKPLMLTVTAFSLVTLFASGPTKAQTWSLEQAIEKALADNPEAKLALHRTEAARAAVDQANAAFWPKLQLRSGYVRTNNPIAVFGAALNQEAFTPSLDFNDVPDADDLSVSGVLAVPLYTGGRNRAARTAAQSSERAAEEEADAVRSALAFEVARAFHTVLKGQEFVRAAEEAVRAFESNLALAGKRYESGTVLKTDVLDLEVRVAAAREDRVRAENAEVLARRALRNLLGLEEGEFLVDDATPPVEAPDADDPSSRSEIAAARANIAAAEAALRQARSGYLPRLDAFGGVEHHRGWELDGSGESYLAGVSLEWNAWDGGITAAKVREARANLAVARETERKLRLAIGLEVERARLHLGAAVERLVVTAKAVEMAEESAELTRHRFEEGLALSSQLIDAESSLTAARVRRAEAEADQRIAVAALRKALGVPQLPASSGGR